MNIVLYSTGCPKCIVLKKKLAAKNIAYSEVNDTKQMMMLGIDTVPVLSVDGNLMGFQDAVVWANEREETI